MRWFTVLFFCLAAVFPLWCAENDDLTRALSEELAKSSNPSLTVVASLLEKGADPNGIFHKWEESRGYPFIMMAIDSKFFQTAQLLIDAGADINKRNLLGGSAAFVGNNPEKLKFLLSNGARFDIFNKEGESPLMENISGSTLNIKGDDEYINMIFSMLEWEEEHSPNFSAGFSNRNVYCTSLLVRLLQAGKISDRAKVTVAERLFKAGADPAARDSDGELFVFRNRYLREGPVIEVLPLFIERGIPLNEFYDGGYSSRRKKTLLMYAAANNSDGSVVKLLLERGAEPNLRNESGQTAFMFAGSASAAAALFEKGADPNLKDNNGNTVLHYWDSKADKQLLDELLSYGCNINEPNLRGFTPLMTAIRDSYDDKSKKYKTAAAIALLEKGADPNLRDNEGRTALHLYLETLFYRHLPKEEAKEVIVVMKALLEAGARPTDTDGKGNTALLLLSKESPWNSEYRPFLSLARKYASKDEVSYAKQVTEKTKEHKEYKEYIGENVFKTSMALGVPLLIGGLSIGMREGVYANDPYKNWMGNVNGFLTLASGGMFLGGLTGLIMSGDSGLEGLIYIFFGAAGGILSGIILSSFPSVQKAFKENPMLYYAPTAISAIGMTIVIFNIWE